MDLEKRQSEIFCFLADTAEKEYVNPSYETTHILPLSTVKQDGKDYDFALVVGWLNYDNYKGQDWDLCAKVAYLQTNSLMQEYDYDWIMPTNKQGDVWDTETSLSDFEEQDVKMMVYTTNWLIEQYTDILHSIDKGELIL